MENKRIMENKIYDIVIVGGGIIGSAIAFNLIRIDKTIKVAVIEMDPAYTRASTALSMANARIQFSLKQNIEMSQYAFKVLEQFEDEMIVGKNKPGIAYHREGNLFLFDQDGRQSALKNLALQKSLGCRIEEWSPEKIKQFYPLFNTNNLAGGTFGPQDGHFDGYAVLMGYKNKARSLGVTYITDEVIEVICNNGEVSGVKLASNKMISSKYVINCAGAWAKKLAQTAGINLPIEPTKRQVFVLEPAVKPKGPLPLTILPSGLYFRTEIGGQILLGKSMDEDPVGFDFNWDDKRFMETLWPELAEFVPIFDTLKLLRGWAGLYAVNTLDGNAILGEWPQIKGLYLANGFSGHGLQQAPAVGRYMAELITGVRPILDLSIFSPKRILEKRTLNERGLV